MTARVSLVKTADREAGVKKAVNLLGGLAPKQPEEVNGSGLDVRGKSVLLKPNFNSADPMPGSTHDDTLRTLVLELQRGGASKITVADRSGMGSTRAVMEQKGIFEMGRSMGFDAVPLDELDRDGWVHIRPEGGHWRNGFYMAKMIVNAEFMVQTCCLKTHRYGGQFSFSLKNAVGMMARSYPGFEGEFTRELHTSPFQRLMIAELNTGYKPDLIVLDGVEAFVDGGPDKGTRVRPEVMLAATDRIALDAVGVAILRLYGTTPEVSRGPIFQQEQIARAVELKLGIDSPDKIELATDDSESEAFATEIKAILMQG